MANRWVNVKGYFPLKFFRIYINNAYGNHFINSDPHDK